MFYYILKIFFIIFICFVIFEMQPFFQARLYELNTQYFKHKKISKFTFLFGITGYSCKDYKEKREILKTEGLNYPMFVIQVVGFIVATICLLTSIVLLCLNINIDLIIIINASVLILMGIVDIFVIFITIHVGKKIEHQYRHNNKNNSLDLIYSKEKQKSLMNKVSKNTKMFSRKQSTKNKKNKKIRNNFK